MVSLVPNTNLVRLKVGERGLTEHYPELGTGLMSTEPYYAEDHFEREKVNLFRRVWLKVGRVEELPDEGSYFVRDLSFADTSILVVRGQDGEIRGFHNICSHRGNKLVWDPVGKVTGFSCRMHGWTYLPDGRLRTVPDENMFYDLDKDACGLSPVHLDVWGGFIFVNLAADAPESLTEYLGEAGSRLAEYPFERATERYTYATELHCNWKVAVDAFTEAYHVVFIHGEWGAGTFTSADNPLCQIPYCGLLDRHAVFGVYGNPEYQPRPTEAVAQQWGSMFTKRDGSAPGWLPASVNPGGSDKFSFEMTHLFPNFLIHVVDGTYFTHEFRPIATDRTLWEGNTYYVPPRNAGERFSQEYAHLLMRENWLEDTTAMEAVQSTLKSGAKQSFWLHDQEILIRHTRKVVMDYVNESP